MSGPEEDVDRVEDAEEGKAPVDRVDDDLLATGGELEDHRAEEEQVDQGPHVEGLSVRFGHGIVGGNVHSTTA